MVTDGLEAVQHAKRLVWEAYQDKPAGGLIPESSYFLSNVEFHGPAPIDRVNGRDELIDGVYAPLTSALPAGRRLPYLFLGGVWGGDVWVAATGTIEGALRRPWLGITDSVKGGGSVEEADREKTPSIRRHVALVEATVAGRLPEAAFQGNEILDVLAGTVDRRIRGSVSSWILFIRHGGPPRCRRR